MSFPQRSCMDDGIVAKKNKIQQRIHGRYDAPGRSKVYTKKKYY